MGSEELPGSGWHCCSSFRHVVHGKNPRQSPAGCFADCYRNICCCTNRYTIPIHCRSYLNTQFVGLFSTIRVLFFTRIFPVPEPTTPWAIHPNTSSPFWMSARIDDAHVSVRIIYTIRFCIRILEKYISLNLYYLYLLKDELVSVNQEITPI